MTAMKKKPRKAGAGTPPDLAAADIQAMLHDLDVHRLELEMQNRELRDAQGQLEESRSRLADLYDFAPVAYVTLDPMGKILEANLTAAAMFGIERGNLIGKFVAAMVAIPDRRALRDHVRRCFGERMRIEAEFTFAVRGRSAVTAHVVSAPFIAPDGAVIGCKTTLTDITALKQGQEQLHLLAQAAGKLVSSFDYRATLAEVARLAVPILADVCIVDLLTADGQMERLEVACASGTVAARVAQFRGGAWRASEDGASAWVMRMRQPIVLGESSPAVAMATAPGFDQDALIRASECRSMMVVPLAARDSVLGVLTFLEVDSGRRFTDSALATARDLAVHAAMAIENARLYESAQQAIRARDDVLTFVSHDLRSPLTGIYLTTEMLLRGAQGHERRKGWGQLERVRRSTQQMQRMIDDLLDLASVEAGRLSIDVGAHSARRLCEDALAMLAPAAAEKAVKLHLDLRHAGLVTYCDRGRVVQVLSNLLGNAVKFTPAGGTVTLSVEQTGDNAQFTVLDTGPGVPPAVREHIFERFWQAEETARKGRGLGLYIAKGLVEAQGGTMWMESPARGGASFSFTLPLSPANDAQRPTQTAPAARPEQRGPRRRPRPAARPG